jgi:LUC7 N_terminus
VVVCSLRVCWVCSLSATVSSVRARRIARFQARVKIDNEEVESGMTLDVRQKVNVLEEQVQGLLAQMERLAESGEVDASQLLNDQVKSIREEQEQMVEVSVGYLGRSPPSLCRSLCRSLYLCVCHSRSLPICLSLSLSLSLYRSVYVALSLALSRSRALSKKGQGCRGKKRENEHQERVCVHPGV